MRATVRGSPKVYCGHHGLDDWFTERCLCQSQGKILSSSGCHFPREAETRWACPKKGWKDGEGCENVQGATVATSQRKRPDVWQTDYSLPLRLQAEGLTQQVQGPRK